MKYIILVPGILLFQFNVIAQGISAFPADDPPRPWGGLGFAYPDVGVTIQAYPRSIPILFRPQIDFGMFQPHGHPVNGGKITVSYITPFSTLGIGRTFIGGVVGYNVDRLNDRLEINGDRVLEEEVIFSWGGVLGEMIQIYDNLFLTGEVRFLNQEVERSPVNPDDAYEVQTFDDFRTTWMVGLQYYFW